MVFWHSKEHRGATHDGCGFTTAPPSPLYGVESTLKCRFLPLASILPVIRSLGAVESILQQLPCQKCIPSPCWADRSQEGQ